MEAAASSSILFPFHAINGSSTNTTANKFYCETPPRNSSFDHSRRLGCKPFFCTFPRISSFPGKCLLSNGFTLFSSSSGSVDLNPSPEFAVLLEVDGVLMDAYRSGNRQAFNVAFRKLGLDCANWTEPIYLDLVRKSAGDEERMLMLFFQQIGWPSSLPTSEKGIFMKSVLREKVFF
uniref:Uncharacterized protein LOC105136633 isoform X2 n=1 Tax=Rhizophora mucronata TaxID=61149 RepID=A0A2P2L8Z2_RHIMU